jgi:hypothetical protein
VKFVIESKNRLESAVLAFELDAEKLICLGETPLAPTFRVPAFDPQTDVFYRSPDKLTPVELAEETNIHFPEHLLEHTGKRVTAASLRGAVLLQSIAKDTLSISPLAALQEVIEKTGSVNSAILEVSNGGLLFVRRSGAETRAHFSTHSFEEFAALSEEERDLVFPDFSALEILVSGPDVERLSHFNFGQMHVVRKIAISDFLSLCEFTEDAMKTIESNPPFYTTAFGAASIVATIAREAHTA